MTKATAAMAEVTGSGEPLMLVHGLGGTGNVWMPQVPVLARTHTVIRPELAGSGRARLDGALSTESLVDSLVALMDAMELERLHLVGHSYGSILAQHLASRHPERVASLMLFGAFRGPPEPARKALRDRAAAARGGGMIDIADATVQMGLSAETKTARPEVAAFVRELVMRQDPDGYAATCEAIAQTDPADLAGVSCPALVVNGDEDNTSPPAAGLAVAEALEDAVLEILGRCGHWTPLERPQEVATLMVNFLIECSHA
ncbi:MAG: alpha/beta hydrolase [Kiloniellales bacterium]